MDLRRVAADRVRAYLSLLDARGDDAREMRCTRDLRAVDTKYQASLREGGQLAPRVEAWMAFALALCQVPELRWAAAALVADDDDDYDKATVHWRAVSRDILGSPAPDAGPAPPRDATPGAGPAPLPPRDAAPQARARATRAADAAPLVPAPPRDATPQTQAQAVPLVPAPPRDAGADGDSPQAAVPEGREEEEGDKAADSEDLDRARAVLGSRHPAVQHREALHQNKH